MGEGGGYRLPELIPERYRVGLTELEVLHAIIRLLRMVVAEFIGPEYRCARIIVQAYLESREYQAFIAQAQP